MAWWRCPDCGFEYETIYKGPFLCSSPHDPPVFMYELTTPTIKHGLSYPKFKKSIWKRIEDWLCRNFGNYICDDR